MVNPTQSIKNLCAELGDTYFLGTIDKENVIRKKLNACHDLEISGADRAKGKYHVFVWSTKDGKEIVERHFDIGSKEALFELLKSIESKY